MFSESPFGNELLVALGFQKVLKKLYAFRHHCKAIQPQLVELTVITVENLTQWKTVYNNFNKGMN